MRIQLIRSALITVTLFSFIGINNLAQASEREHSLKQRYANKQGHSNNRERYRNNQRSQRHREGNYQRHNNRSYRGYRSRPHSSGYIYRDRGHANYGYAHRVRYGHRYRAGYGHPGYYGVYRHDYDNDAYVSPVVVGINLHLD